ncbi:MAG TPA: hypothetical protein VK087_03470 [Tissierellaceae bacterium]|nr:hypothetical protein [Tissierellaceae bacterium]
MEEKENFEQILNRFKKADLDEKIEMYTTLQGLSVEQFKELLRYFPIKHLSKLETSMG